MHCAISENLHSLIHLKISINFRSKIFLKKITFDKFYINTIKIQTLSEMSKY